MDYVATINPAVKTASSLFNEFTSDKQSRMIYENHMKIIRDRNTMLDDAISQGIELGRMEGSHSNAIKIANNLLAIGLPLKQIAEVTGLTIEEVENLRG